MTTTRREWDERVADLVVNPVEVKVAEECKRLTEGKGVDVVFDAAGVERALKDGVETLRYGGTYVNVAGWETPFAIPWFPFMLKDMKVQGSMAYNDQDFAETVKAYAEVEKGFEELITNKDNHIKIMISPD